VPAPWQVWIDRGGTFTDCVARDPTTGRIDAIKLLSSDDAPVAGIRALLRLRPDEPIPPCDVRMGTTRATNALLERRGVPTALLITRGLGDLLEIGDQTRPELFAVDIRRPALLHQQVLEVDARMAADGTILSRPDPGPLRSGLEALRRDGIVSLAVVVIHAHVDGSLEREIGALAREVGFRHVSLSHEVAPEIGLLGRGDTTVADAYLTPLLVDYLESLARHLPGSRLRLMQSNGTLTLAERFRGRDAVLSGPAGGVVACTRIARARSLSGVIAFDMGGTSTDVTRIGERIEHVHETVVAGIRLRTPMMDVHTVAAGGGSICRYQPGRFTVGPDSAGAVPGPLCYGRPEATELTLTDVSLWLGRLADARFPFPLTREPVRRRLEQIRGQLRAAGDTRSLDDIARAFLELAVDDIAQAIRRVTVARGHDAREHALIVFGGAGGQFAGAVARRLGIRTLLFHPWAGVLSAWGMGVADVGWHGEADAGRTPLSELDPGRVERWFASLEARARAALAAEGPAAAIEHRRRLDLRYEGTETHLGLDLAADDTPATLRARFERRHLAELGWVRGGHPIEVATARLEATLAADEPPAGPVLARESLAVGARLSGPALILEETGTIVLEPGWEATVEADGLLVARDGAPGTVRVGSDAAAAATEPDPLLLELFAHRFSAISEQMGTVLRRTAASTNIRDRLDFSCAVFDGRAGLVANAPHIPVHLGAMSESVRAVLAAHPDPKPGDVFLTNDPAGGGSHLPDLTVVTPVHDDAGVLRYFTASRGHHADIGGITPGSMPPSSCRLDEEGIVFRAERIVHGGVFERDALERRLRASPWPARRPAENLGDIEAQIAANRAGERLLHELARAEGHALVLAYMAHVQRDAERAVRRAIAALPSGARRFEDALDDGTPIAVGIERRGDRLVVDFSGTGPEHPGNLNAPRAVTVAALLYVLRILAARPIPLNAGCLAPIDLILPRPSILDPGPDRAVAAGNVETSQRIVDVLLGALGLAAASQGTMNNLSFGTETWGYYETIAGGAGAGPGFCGASAVQTHMTNTRITDPELLETRFPVRLWTFARRRGSGGDGRWRGGDGVVRELEFLAPVRASILSERRHRAPFGLEGGDPGARGRNRRGAEDLDGRVVVDLSAGERLRIETPGGGGFGRPDEPSGG
jgi:5-oxoprolinase (ATP-hydrolysing)